MRDPHALIDCRPPSDLDFQRIFAMVPTQLMVVDRGLGIVCANALKYGNDDQIAIAWSHDPQANGTFELSWVETGSRIETDFPPTGVICRMQGTIAS